MFALLLTLLKYLNIRHLFVISCRRFSPFFTSHFPTLEVVANHHKGSVLNSAFATDLNGFIFDNHIDAWIYGHSHTNINTEINGTKVVCNQMGYIFQNEHITNGFDPSKCFIL